MIPTGRMVKLIQNTDNLTVLILAAGHGRRMGPFSRMVNKSLVPYKNRPLISHIMEKFPADTKFVVACGNLGQQVKDYVISVHEDKNVVFVDIPEFDESSTGPATTIRYCEKHLPGAFFWISCDTLFEFSFKDNLDHNWIAVSPVNDSVSQDYCWIERDGNNIVEVHNKVKSNHAVDAFIGLMYVKDREYIDTLIKKSAREVFEGFVPELNLKAHTVKMWQDFGTYEKWQDISKDLPELSFPKPDELFYRDNGKIIKFTTDATLAKLKYVRSTLNPACMPDNVSYIRNFLIYTESPGDTLYNCLTVETFLKFLEWAEESVWRVPGVISPRSTEIASEFYHKKTVDRISKFRTKYNTWEECSTVNGVAVKTIDEYISLVDFRELTENTLWCFTHGDMQFDNIIFDAATKKFTAIDWRTDFSGNLYGDIYYDLAKMLGGLYLSYKLVKEDAFSYTEENGQATITIPSVDNVSTYVDHLRRMVVARGLSWQKVRTLVPIIYLNMAPLHDAPFDKFLIALAQYFFSQL